MEEKESRSDVAKAFSKSKEEPKPSQKSIDKKEAQDVIAYIVNVLSSGSIEVRVKNPCRKTNYAKIARIVSIHTNFHLREIKVTIAYGQGKQIFIKGKKEFVPFTDTTYLSNLEILRIVQDKPKIEKDEQKNV